MSNHVDVTAQIQIANTHNPLPKPNSTQQDFTNTLGGEQSIQQNVPFDLPLNMSVTDINSVFHDNQALMHLIYNQMLPSTYFVPMSQTTDKDPFSSVPAVVNASEIGETISTKRL